jgi:hypothetical protein
MSAVDQVVVSQFVEKTEQVMASIYNHFIPLSARRRRNKTPENTEYV